ncbi:unnamed protein product [Moneuplotes crassus]|uniref:Uncharacterized protein n=1 Tax=Euplotes crassus TaxID=5936 RepID=A0AAD1X5W5_EUPCR|nr:unnamed protein product [Moneuplotes crassus]
MMKHQTDSIRNLLSKKAMKCQLGKRGGNFKSDRIDQNAIARKNNRKSLFVLIKGEIKQSADNQEIKISKNEESQGPLFWDPSKVYSLANKPSLGERNSHICSSRNSDFTSHRRGTSASCKQGTRDSTQSSQKQRSLHKKRTNSMENFTNRRYKRTVFKLDKEAKKLTVVSGKKLTFKRKKKEVANTADRQNHREKLHLLLGSNEINAQTHNLRNERSSKLQSIKRPMTSTFYDSKTRGTDLEVLESYCNYENKDNDQNNQEPPHNINGNDHNLAKNSTEESYNFIVSSPKKDQESRSKHLRAFSDQKLDNKGSHLLITEDVNQFCPKYNLDKDPMIIQSMKIKTEKQNIFSKCPQKLHLFLKKMHKKLRRTSNSSKSTVNLNQQRSSSRLSKPRIQRKSMILRKKLNSRKNNTSKRNVTKRAFKHCRATVQNIYVGNKSKNISNESVLKKKISINLLQNFTFDD